VTEPAPDPAERTAAAVTATYPGLRRAESHSLGEPLSAVRLAPT